jgi:hypothetical protein
MTLLRRLAPPERLTAGAGIALLICMLAVPWYHQQPDWSTSRGGLVVTADHSVLGGPGRFCGLAALVILVLLLAELIYSRLAPPRQPARPPGRTAAELSAALAVGSLLVIRTLVHLGDFGWGFYPVMLSAAVLVYGALAMGRGESVHPANVLAGR